MYNWTQNDFIQDWVRGRAVLNTKKSSDKLQRHPYEPCYLYETGIQPLQQYPIKGVIWYQGESNAQNIETHERLFPLLVESWRKNWGEEFPFYYVQLSSIDRPSWTWFRNSQRELMETIPNSGMAVSSDRGDSLNVHPVYKREIGNAWPVGHSTRHTDMHSLRQVLYSVQSNSGTTPPTSPSIMPTACTPPTGSRYAHSK